MTTASRRRAVDEGGDYDDDDDNNNNNNPEAASARGDYDDDTPLDPREYTALCEAQRDALAATLQRVRRANARRIEALSVELDRVHEELAASNAARDEARTELARLRADQDWARVQQTSSAAAATAMATAPAAVVRYVADLQARCTYAELRYEMRVHAHAMELARVRGDAERDAGIYAVHLAACRREVAELRAAAPDVDAAALDARRAELATLEARVCDARATLAGLRGEMTGCLGAGTVERLRAAVQDTVRAETAAQMRAEIAAAIAEARARAAKDTERMRAAAHEAHEALLRHRAEGSRLLVSLEKIARDKCAADVVRVRRDLERILAPHTAALTAGSAAHVPARG